MRSLSHPQLLGSPNLCVHIHPAAIRRKSGSCDIFAELMTHARTHGGSGLFFCRFCSASKATMSWTARTSHPGSMIGCISWQCRRRARTAILLVCSCAHPFTHSRPQSACASGVHAKPMLHLLLAASPTVVCAWLLACSSCGALPSRTRPPNQRTHAHADANPLLGVCFALCAARWRPPVSWSAMYGNTFETTIY